MSMDDIFSMFGDIFGGHSGGGFGGFGGFGGRGGRRSRIPVRTGCGRQENESPHPQCHPAFFTPHAHPGKSKTSPDQLTKRRFQYPEPVLKSQKLRKYYKSKIKHNSLYINK